MTIKSNPNYTLTGRITNRQGEPLEGLIVRAYDQDPKTPANPLGDGVTDAAGRYTIRLTAKDFKIGGVENGGPNVFIRVYDGDRLLGENPVKRNAKNRITVDLQVEYGIVSDQSACSPKAGAATEQYVLSGRVTRHDGSGASGVTVRAFARRLRTEAPLGDARAGPDGTYRIAHAPPPGEPLDVVVRGFRDGHPVAEASRPAAGADERVDLTLPRDGKSEYEAVLADVSPSLDGAALTDLVEDGEHQDFSYLARATGRDPLRLACLTLAHRHAAATELPAELFYGLLRQGLPADLSVLGKRPLDDLRAALAAAAAAGVIGTMGDQQADDFATRLRALEVAAVIDPPEGAPVAPIAEIFAAAVPDVSVRERIYNTYLDLDGGPTRFWAKLRRNDLTAPHADRLRLALQLGALTGNNAPLVQALLARFDSGDLGHPRDLARLDAADWCRLVEESGGVPDTVRALLAPPHTVQEAAPEDATRRVTDETAR